MAANPLTYADLEAYERKALVYLPAWETDLIMRLDDAVLAATDAAKPVPTKDEPVEIPTSDVKSVKGLFRGLAKAKQSKP